MDGANRRKTSEYGKHLSQHSITKSPSRAAPSNSILTTAKRTPHKTKTKTQSLNAEHNVHIKSQLVPPPPNEAPPTTQTDKSLKPKKKKMLDFLLDCILINDPDGLGWKAYASSVAQPVTLESVAELEISRILNNPVLRHDINFDRELHFRPNHDGKRGKQKLKANKQFYEAIRFELQIIESYQLKRLTAKDVANDATEEERFKEDEKTKQKIKDASKRLPLLFIAVKDILKSLVPEAEQRRISEHLDDVFLMQQIVNGVCDLTSIARWLAKVIKTHCAPMRDAKVDAMERTIIEAVENTDMRGLAKGLELLVNLMEAMKLDVANHQIRHIRSHLVKNTVEFQKRYNAHRMRTDKMDTGASLKWFHAAMEGEGLSLQPVDALCAALLRDLINPQDSEPFQMTFYLDFDRLKPMSTEIQGYIAREVCCEVLRQTLLERKPGCSTVEATSKLQLYLSASHESHEWYQSNTANIAAQITRIIADSSMDLLEQFRCSETIEALLLERLDLDSDEFCRQRTKLYERVLPKLQHCVNHNLQLTPVELQDALVPQSIKHTSRSLGHGATLVPARIQVSTDPDGNLVRRLAHILVLHWQVWADLLYLTQSETRTQSSPGSAKLGAPTLSSYNTLSHSNTHCSTEASSTNHQTYSGPGLLDGPGEPPVDDNHLP